MAINLKAVHSESDREDANCTAPLAAIVSHFYFGWQLDSTILA